jgi:ATP-dependent Clp protease protease subunit
MRIRDQVVGLYMQHTGKEREELERALDRDNYMTPQQAVAFGLIDRVIEGRDKTALKTGLRNGENLEQ